MLSVFSLATWHQWRHWLQLLLKKPTNPCAPRASGTWMLGSHGGVPIGHRHGSDAKKKPKRPAEHMGCLRGTEQQCFIQVAHFKMLIPWVYRFVATHQPEKLQLCFLPFGNRQRLARLALLVRLIPKNVDIQNHCKWHFVGCLCLCN